MDAMSPDVESFLYNYLQVNYFSIQLDQLTLLGNRELLLPYVLCFVMNEEIYEELPFAKNLTANTKGYLIFNVLKNYFSPKFILLLNIIAGAVNRAPAMFWRYNCFINYLKKLPGVFVIHCVIHQQHLVATNLSTRLHKSLQLPINAINKIRRNLLNSKLFLQLCQKNDEDFI